MQNNNCLFCEKQRIEGTIHYPTLLQTVPIQFIKALYLKYNSQDEMSIDDLIKHAHKKWVIDFYEKSQEIQDQEFLKKYYDREHGIVPKLIDLTEYYKYSLDTPNLFMLPLFKLIKNYNKLRKEYHYTKIKYKLKILVPQNGIKVDKKYTQLLQLTMSNQEDEQQSLISLLNKFQPQQIAIPKQLKSYTQQSCIQTTKLHTKPLIKKSEQASYKLKSIVNGDIVQQQPQLLSQQQQYQLQRRTQSKSHSNIKFHTLQSVNNNSKKQSIAYNKSNLQPIKTLGQSKIGSQADIISNIQIQNTNSIGKTRSRRKLIQLFYK
ncbi:unnamed protein product (macronuclear) [Paramecium tetraurelia]|uniref:Uncharacterized protein n=1 Tax=Paramecium tetraurelia TaxID=5888 RepID=A0CNG8_PARTE|nr:uncharacterized protein GSPATT00008777001 [Paramecium tetraurelia]CAK72335.1 unnamed protein product [Paramecium tetraurelia]|eukprot:XP_001439732.1 hypothetical protein (macronuclear) [Paramecium tetraurelia strain d4-2]